MSLLYTILSRIPFDIKDAAKEILNAILTSKNTIGWNSKLQLIVDDRVVPRTNVADLVAHVLYPHDERIKDPIGFNVFVQGLKDIRLESEWVENEIEKSVLESAEDDTGETSDSEDEDSDDDDVSEDDGQDESEDEQDESENGDDESENGDDESENGDDESEMDS
mgnify:CR=1 FL=1